MGTAEATELTDVLDRVKTWPVEDICQGSEGKVQTARTIQGDRGGDRGGPGAVS